MFNKAEMNTEIADDKNKVLDLQALAEVAGGRISWSTASSECTEIDTSGWSATSVGCG